MKERFYIVHGYGADKNSNFFPWIKKCLNQVNIECTNLNMPNTDFPVLEEWLNHLNKNIQIMDKTYFIAHSLGCITTLKFIEQLNTKIAGVILVSGFDESLDLFPQLKGFTNKPVNYEKLIENINLRISVASEDDDLVPIKHSIILNQHLKGKLFSLKNYGHFLVSTCPELWKIIQNIINN